MRVRPDPDPRVMLERLGRPLLALLATSPDFQPAAESLQAIAQALRASDYPLAQQVLAAVREVTGPAASAAQPASTTDVPRP